MQKLLNLIKNIRIRKFNDLFFIFVLLLVFFLKGPSLIEQFKKQGTKVDPIVFNGELFPAVGKKSVLIFWASWCPPCTVELGRIQKAIEENEISPINIYAVNMGEPLPVLTKVLKERALKIPVVHDENGELARLFNVQVTPTIIFIDSDGFLNWITSGLSPTLIYRIKYFLKD